MGHVVTAGDGYACKNESLIAFGLGLTDQIDDVTVQWPDGIEQTFSIPQLDQRYLLVEGCEDAFAEPPTSR